MKFCPTCGTSIADDATFCPSCGHNIGTAGNAAPVFTPNFSGNANPNPNGGYAPGYNPAPAYDPYDHTAEFDSKDISDNKVICMLLYLSGVVGIFIALLMASSSKYVAFHLRQALKFEVVTILGSLVSALLVWTLIVPIAFGVLMVALMIVRIICFLQICKGQAKEPAIIKSLEFLR